ncbi:phosphoglycerate dehydrogenase [Candidatus Poribacteria bacterium]|nr:phosphoglycerate dehydrogenase [Candidatus Poribacteria bacterium]
MQRWRVLVSDPLGERGLEILRAQPDVEVDVKTSLSHDELMSSIPSYHALLVRSHTRADAALIQAGTNLKVIGRAGVGTDNIDVEAATRNGIVVMNSPTGNTVSAAEHTLTMILALSRNIALANASLREGRWERSAFTGVEVYGKTLGILGLGRIGTEVARRARGFGMKILGVDPYISHGAAEKLSVQLVGLPDLIKNSDYITVHIPLTQDTHHLFGAEEFAAMKRGVRIVNCARGGIFDEVALRESIQSGHCAGAALDVFENEPEIDPDLVGLPNVLATPHLGASTAEAQENISIEIATQCLNALRGKPVQNAINLPSVDARTLEVLGPYLQLAEKMGSLQAQLIDATIHEVIVEYTGGLFDKNVTPVTVAVQKGLLSPALPELVNYVNAPFYMQQRGIRVTETRSSSHDVFANLLTVTVRTDKGDRLISGTVFGRELRLVMLDDYHVSATPDGGMLLVYNNDQPGAIGVIGTLLGKHGINIADMSVGREGPGGRAVMLINVDGIVPRELIHELQSQKQINSVRFVVLPAL